MLAAGLVLWLVDPAEVWAGLTGAEPRYVLAACAALALTVVVAAVKVKVVLSAVGLSVSARRCASAVLASATLNSFVPARGGDLFRALFLVDRKEDLPRVGGAVVVERLIDVFALGGLAIGAAAFTATPGPALFIGIAACVLAVAGGGLLVAGVPFARGLADRLAAVLAQLRSHPGRLVLALGLSMVTWSCNTLVLAACLRAVGVELALPVVFANGPIAILAGVMPVSVAGIGTRDATLVLLLRDAGDAVAAGGVLYTVVMYGILPLFGLAFLGRETLRRRWREA